MKPIGIFDSGVGGLTIFKEIRKVFPHDDIIYLGDTARLPYGTKSKESIIKFSRENVRFLLSKDVKIIVVACNTASALAIEELEKEFDIPIIGVIKIGAKLAADISKNRNVGIIGTIATIKSKAYSTELTALDNTIQTHSKSCPMFVPLVENGYENHEIAKILIEEYLQDFPNIDTLILGCTHYPVLKERINEYFQGKINLVDSGVAISNFLKTRIKPSTKNKIGKNQFFVTDDQENFLFLSRKILNDPNIKLEHVNLI